MQRLASKLLAIGGLTDEDHDRNFHQDTIGLIPRTQPADERLNSPGVSSFRIHSKNIELASLDGPGGGSHAKVVQTKFGLKCWRNEQSVEVKKLRSINELIHEVEVLARLSHKNIVQLIGFVEDLEQEIAWIVLSWEPNGNVSDFLTRADWEIPHRISLIQDTFDSILYLHTRQPPICHGDLKSLNILVSSSCRAILTNFSSARAIIESEDRHIDHDGGRELLASATIEQAGPPIQVAAAGNQWTLTGPAESLRWAPPEVASGGRPGLSSDIWAVGWVCWEVMTKTKANQALFSELEPSSETTIKVIEGWVPLPREEAQLAPLVALCSLMKDCWAFSPSARPGISRCYNEVQLMPSEPPLGPRTPSARLLLQMGRIQFNQARYDESASLCQQALALATSEGNQIEAAAALTYLGDTYRFASRYAEAENIYNQAQEIYIRIGHDVGRAGTLRGLGCLNRSQSKYAQARESFNRAEEIYSHIGDDLARANMLTEMGEISTLQSEYNQAEGSFISARDIYSHLGDDRGLAKVLDGLGEMYLARSRYAAAEETFTRAQTIYTRIGDDRSRAAMVYKLGRVYRDQAKYPEAEELYTRALEISARSGDEVGQANAMFALGDLLFLQAKWAEGEEWVTRAQKIYTSDCNVLGQAKTLYALGLVRHNQGRSAEAAIYYVEAKDLFTQLGMTDMSDRIADRLAKVSSPV